MTDWQLCQGVSQLIPSVGWDRLQPFHRDPQREAALANVLMEALYLGACGLFILVDMSKIQLLFCHVVSESEE